MDGQSILSLISLRARHLGDGQKTMGKKHFGAIRLAMLRPYFNFESYGVKPTAGIRFLVSPRSAHVPDREDRGHSGFSS